MRAVLVLMVLVMAPAAAFAQDYFGAIAYSPSTGSQGWSYDHNSRDAAETRALSECRKHANDCRALVWFKNACGALATGPKGYGTGWGDTQSLADSYAMKVCGQHSSGCSVKRRVCTTR